MKNLEFMSSTAGKRILAFDPRTKLLLLILIATFVLGGLGDSRMEVFNIILSMIPVILLIISGNVKFCVFFILLYALSWLGLFYAMDMTSGIVNHLILGTCGIITRFLPGAMMGMYAVRTTTVSEFVASMEKMHVTNKIIIPMSVMFRFFPTVSEEIRSINEAMKMRGVSFAGGKIDKILEYRMVPMMACCVRAGEELSAAALTRGYGGPVKRTNICKIGFGLQDYIVFAFSIVLILYWMKGIIL